MGIFWSTMLTHGMSLHNTSPLRCQSWSLGSVSRLSYLLFIFRPAFLDFTDSSLELMLNVI